MPISHLVNIEIRNEREKHTKPHTVQQAHSYQYLTIATIHFMKKIISLASIIAIVSTANVLASGPGKGELKVRGSGAITSIEVKYNISQLMGEPTVLAVYKWSSSTLKEINSDTVLWLKVQSEDGRSTAFIRSSPTVPKEGEWAYDATGSPNWDKVLVKSWNGTEAEDYFSADVAKSFWKAGFKVVGAQFSKTYK